MNENYKNIKDTKDNYKKLIELYNNIILKNNNIINWPKDTNSILNLNFKFFSLLSTDIEIYSDSVLEELYNKYKNDKKLFDLIKINII